MKGDSKLSVKALALLAPGEWAWEGGIGYRRHKSRDGGSWYLKYRANGRQVPERVPYCRTKAQAEALLAVRHAEIVQGTIQPKKREQPWTLRQALEHFKKSKADLDTIENYTARLEKIIPFFGWTTLVRDVKREQVLDFYVKRKAERATATANNEVNYFKSLLTECMFAGQIEVNVARTIRLSRARNKRERVLTPDEVNRLFAAAHAAPERSFIRPLLYVLYYAGPRIAEAVSLRWDDVDFEGHAILFRDTKNGEDEVKPMSDELELELKRWRLLTKGTWVFVGHKKGTHLTAQGQRRKWKALLESAGVSKDVIRHTMRHHFTTQLTKKNTKVIAKQITGHKSDSSLGRYSHIEIDALRPAVNAIPAPDVASGERSRSTTVIPLQSVKNGRRNGA